MPAFDPAAATGQTAKVYLHSNHSTSRRNSKASQAPRSAAVLFITGQVSSRQAVIAASSRSAARPGWHLHAPADPVQQQIQPGQGAVHPNRRRTSSAILASVQH